MAFFHQANYLGQRRTALVILCEVIKFFLGRSKNVVFNMAPPLNMFKRPSQQPVRLASPINAINIATDLQQEPTDLRFVSHRLAAGILAPTEPPR